WMTAENTVRKAEVNLSKAQKDLERVKLLYEAQGATIDDVETARQQVDLYREDLKLAQFSLEQLRKEPDGANFLAADHRKLWIKAPFEGVISKVDAKPGAKVTADTLLLNIAADDSVEIVADVDESQINQVKTGQTASVILNDNDETEMSGTVTAIGKTGTEDAGVIVFPVTIRLPQTSKINSGMSADVTIYITSRKNVLSIPVNAVVKKRGRDLVNVLRGKTVERVEVELGEVNEAYVEVLSGVQPRDRILVAKTPVDDSKDSDSQKNNRSPFMGAGPMGGPLRGGR
ncbi:MAG TPA: efflux RND transporter periplasmic adaptor subunit, partial [Bacillota bacterium]|nr:efflux RND transporter periplasmic adaptor subunit [Bacillota bacterium]